jgi:hypothetical protein
MKRLTALAVVVLLAGAASFSVYAFLFLSTGARTYPSVIDPGQAYLLPNGTLYMSVYNSGTDAVTLNSLQVAYLPDAEAQGAYSVLQSPNAALSDGAIKIFCCTGYSGSQTLASSEEWRGGGTVEAGGVALLKFSPPTPLDLGAQSYYVAIANQWFPTANLEPFVITGVTSYALPSFVPTRAIIYPNETMLVALIGTSPSPVGATVNVSLRFPMSNGWPLGLSNVSYAVFPEGGPWYRLVPGRTLQPYLPLSAEAYDYGNDTSLAIYGMSKSPVVFQDRLVTQIPPILAPTSWEASESWSSNGPLTMSYAVRWQISPSGAASYQLPVTLYGGEYQVNASQEVQVQVGKLQLPSPGAFNTTYFDGNMTVTPVGNEQPNSPLDITLSFGPSMQGVEFNAVSSSAVTQPPLVVLVLLVIAVALTAYIAARRVRRKGVRSTLSLETSQSPP